MAYGSENKEVERGNLSRIGGGLNEKRLFVFRKYNAWSAWALGQPMTLKVFFAKSFDLDQRGIVSFTAR